MTRVSALAVLFFAAMTLAVTNVNAQCSSCDQSAPVFAQAYTPAPVYSAMPSYATPQYTTTAYTPAPIQTSDCVGCGAQPMAAPVAMAPVGQTYTTMPAQGCCGAPAQSCCPQPSCCPDPCCGSSKPSFRERRAARRAERQARKNNCCDPCATSCCN